MRLLIAKGANVKATDTAGISPLLAAASVDDAEVAKLLIDSGADVNARADVGFAATPLMAAAVNGNLELARLLLARGAKVDPFSGPYAAIVKNGPVLFGHNTALHLSIASGNVDMVRLLLEAGAAVDAVDARGMTPLIWSIQRAPRSGSRRAAQPTRSCTTSPRSSAATAAGTASARRARRSRTATSAARRWRFARSSSNRRRRAVKKSRRAPNARLGGSPRTRPCRRQIASCSCSACTGRMRRLRSARRRCESC